MCTHTHTHTIHTNLIIIFQKCYPCFSISNICKHFQNGLNFSNLGESRPHSWKPRLVQCYYNIFRIELWRRNASIPRMQPTCFNALGICLFCYLLSESSASLQSYLCPQMHVGYFLFPKHCHFSQNFLSLVLPHSFCHVPCRPCTVLVLSIPFRDRIFGFILRQMGG